jgi:DNA (cytosine-5)-methyltransferase 1
MKNSKKYNHYSQKNQLYNKNPDLLSFINKDNDVELNKNSDNKKYKVASLFAGIGGIDLGFQKAGFKIEWANEIDKYACKTYNSNFEHKIICDDIKNIDGSKLPKVDILTGGFPCQAFSIAGYRKGLKDERGTLIFELLRISKEVNPRILFLENVKNLISHNKGQTFRDILEAIEDMGYKVKYKILNTCEYSNIPQNRERIYIICFKNNEEYNKFEFPLPETNRLSIQDVLEDQVDNYFYYTDTKYYPILKEVINNKNTVYQWRRQYVRENKSNLCPTLTANMGTGGHNVPLILDHKDIRKLTPKECARLQGFPNDFILPKDLPNSALYKQMGNSVTVPVIEKIAKKILEIL